MELLKSATRISLLLLVLALVASLFVPVNAQMVGVFKDALMLVLGAYFGMKTTEKTGQDGLGGK